MSTCPVFTGPVTYQLDTRSAHIQESLQEHYFNVLAWHAS